jgi:hypothetical protein
VTKTVITTTTHTINIEEKYKVQVPEYMQEAFMSDSEEEGGKFLFITFFSSFFFLREHANALIARCFCRLCATRKSIIFAYYLLIASRKHDT